jgi:mycothiol synthase
MAATADHDGVPPLSEHVLLRLKPGEDQHAERADGRTDGGLRNDAARHLLARNTDGTVVGYAHLDLSDSVDGPGAELAVHPAYRNRGIGRALGVATIRAAAAADPAGRLRVWAHGYHPAAARLADSFGLRHSRDLLRMRLSLLDEIPAPVLPAGVRLRAFRPGRDEQAWLAVNQRAFADHPEQGGWTLEDVRLREAEPWFDPAGFLLAVRTDQQRGQQRDQPQDRQQDRHGEQLLGFGWTKVHGNAGSTSTGPDHQPIGHEPIGEVYVVGVDPSAQHLRLGTALTLAGLRHLRGRGLTAAMLYVDESNTRAVQLYERLGFQRWSVDVSFQLDADTAAGTEP